ncbi:MAG: magnesium chelatase subunit D [Gemmatimonadetes bacterium]|nr:magnesium chelatase subunit D [Gemmatimonadota bacterium]
MDETVASPLDARTQAELAATLLAIDPIGFGGAVVRAPRADIAESWLAMVRSLLVEGTPIARLPISIPDDRLLGGLDLAMTLATGRPVVERGLLARTDGGVLILPCAERASDALIARLTSVLDTQRTAPRGPFAGEPTPARVAIIALDEGDGVDERTAAALTDRLAFHLTLSHEVSPDGALFTPTDLRVARASFPKVTISEARITTLVTVSLAFGIDSLRAVSFAVRVARGAAALDGRRTVRDDDCQVAAALVLGPRATRLPAPSEASAEPEPPPPPSDPADAESERDERPSPEELQALEDLMIQAMQATLPIGLTIEAPSQGPRQGGSAGRSGDDRAGGLRGRQVGTRRGDPRGGGRLDLLETLRAAAPWQRLRPPITGHEGRVLVRVRPDDFRIRRLIEPAGTTAIFVVDASGSAALHRMAEAKGAVELLLAEAYSRRDEVGLIAFRGNVAEVLLPPTRAIAAAKRALAALPGGGGTPLASAIDRARELAVQARRTGNDTVVVFLTDARANIARDGSPGRPQAEADALASASALRVLGGTTVLIDTSPRPSEMAQRMAEVMGARYVALPRTDAQGIHAAVAAAMPRASA